jgi:4-amino-4-deoxy-L-arabinose transferase-like glycosyltransferase
MTDTDSRLCSESHIRPRVAIPSLLVLSSLLYLGTAGSPALVDGDVDAAHALVVREMLQRHDYVIMFMNGIRYLIRPPLHFWLTAASYAFLGESAFSTRLPLALAMMALVLMVDEFGRHFFGGRAGFYAALVVGTSVGMFIFTRVMIPEAIYAFEFTLFFYLFLRSWTGSLDKRLGYWGAAACCAFGMLTRGPIGVVFPVGGVAVFIILTKSWQRWRELHVFSSLAVFLAIAAPWHILAELRSPGFLWQYFVNENVNRALGTRIPHDYAVVPLGLWWVVHLIWFFPWSIFGLFALRECPPLRDWGKTMSRAAQAQLLLFIWAGFIFFFFSIEHGSRMEYYSFGAWPAVALLLGSGLARAEKTDFHPLFRVQIVIAAVGILVSSALIVLAFMTLHMPGARGLPDILRNSQPTGLYEYSMAPLLDFTWQTFTRLHTAVLLAAFSLSGALTAAWFLRKRRLHVPCNVVMAIGMVGFFFAANMAYKSLEPELSSQALASQINRYSRPGVQVALYGDIRVAASIGFYTRRRLLLYKAGGSNLEYGSRLPDAGKIFLSDDDFSHLWNGADQVFLVVANQQTNDALKRLPADLTWLLAASGGKTVYANQPTNPGQLPLAAEHNGQTSPQSMSVDGFTR